MKRHSPTMFLVLALAAGCAAKTQLPPDRLAGSEAAVRMAEQAGADTAENPSAQLHMRLARDQLALAKQHLEKGDARRADLLSIRARVDAELAQALAERGAAKKEVDRVKQQIAELRASSGGATPGASEGRPIEPAPGGPDSDMDRPARPELPGMTPELAPEPEGSATDDFEG